MLAAGSENLPDEKGKASLVPKSNEKPERNNCIPAIHHLKQIASFSSALFDELNPTSVEMHVNFSRCNRDGPQVSRVLVATCQRQPLCQ